MTSVNDEARAPFLLLIVGWMTMISGALQVAAGILLMVFRDDILDNVRQYTSNELTGFAIAVIIVGLIYILVGSGFLSLNAFALTLGLVVSGLAVAGNIAFLLANDGNHEGVVASLIINAIVLIAVSSGFAARSRT